MFNKKISRSLIAVLVFQISLIGFAQTGSTSSSSALSNLPSGAISVKADTKTETVYKPTYTGTIKITTLGRSIQDPTIKSTVGWSFVEAGIDTKFNDWATFNFAIVGVFGEGAAQNFLADEGAGASAVVIDAAGLELKPLKELTLKAGVIGYKINPLVTVMTPGTSLASEEKLEFANSNETLKIAAIGNQAIPSIGLTKGMVEQEKNPFFVSGSLQGDIKVNPIRTTLKAAITEYRFGNLPKGVVSGALTAGNSADSVIGSGDNLQFAIGFSGTETAAVLETEWTSKFKSILKGLYIQNDRAFDDANKGQLGTLELNIKTSGLILKPRVTLFNIQADVTPAPFTILASRYNNRKGQSVGFDVEFEKQKVVLFSKYSNLDEVKDSPYMFDREIYNLGLEVNYDLF